MNFSKSNMKRDMKHFDREVFRSDLISEISKIGSDYNVFDDTFNKVLDKHAPIKTKLLRANHKPYVTKAMRKAIMKRSELASKYRRSPTDENLKAWKKHKNYCSNLYKKERKNYYESLDMNNLTDNKKFWDTIKPIFSNKAKGSSNITLVEDKKLITSEKDVAETLNKHFIESVRKLVENDSSSAYITENSTKTDPISKIIDKFRYHPSILSIKKNVKSMKFSFKHFSEEDIATEIKKFDPKKSSTGILIKF